MPSGTPKAVIIGEFNLETKEIKPAPNSISFSCVSSVKCCSKLDIPISDPYIQELQNFGYNLDQIVGEASPLLKLPTIGDTGVEKFYWMNRREFTNTCRFLGNDNKCQIYDLRPFGCQIFPFSIEHLDENKVQVNLHPDMICPSVKSSGNMNHVILEDILNKYIDNLTIRKNYFNLYGRKV